MKMKTSPPSQSTFKKSMCALCVFLKKILEGYRLDFKRFAIRIILWSIRYGFDNFSTPRFFTVSAYLQECCSVFSCNGVWIEL